MQRHPAAVDTVQARSLLGAALLGQGDYVKAEPLLIEAYEGLVESERKLPPGHGGFLDQNPVTDVLDRLVRLYDRWEKPTEAAKWRAELDARQPKPASPSKK